MSCYIIESTAFRELPVIHQFIKLAVVSQATTIKTTARRLEKRFRIKAGELTSKLQKCSKRARQNLRSCSSLFNIKKDEVEQVVKSDDSKLTVTVKQAVVHTPLPTLNNGIEALMKLKNDNVGGKW
jgi:hypothetical protein